MASCTSWPVVLTVHWGIFVLLHMVSLPPLGWMGSLAWCFQGSIPKTVKIEAARSLDAQAIAVTQCHLHHRLAKIQRVMKQTPPLNGISVREFDLPNHSSLLFLLVPFQCTF